MPPLIYTIGHSTRATEELLVVLGEAGIRILADVRRFPASRRYPHFNRAHLEHVLPEAGIEYVWLGESLGGRRRGVVPAERSPNSGWQVAAFRAYADFMGTSDFQAGIGTLETLARSQRTALMCAERLWWSCHRRLIADYLTVHGWSVIHLFDVGQQKPHLLTEFACVIDGTLTYPGLL